MAGVWSYDWLLLGFLAFAAAERLYERRFSNQAKRGDVKMLWSYVAFHIMHTLIYVGTGVEYFLLRRAAVYPLVVLGLILFAVSLLLRLMAIRALGRYWSLNLEIRKDHQLVREGIYRYMRHPAYSAIMLEVISIPLVGTAWCVLALSVGVYIPLLLVRWWREEREMVGKFGEVYEQYRREVPAFLPWRFSRGGGR
ncbi:MAG: isoprenylcysteine carboxylmethyltransferase family protein [Verrucomicrobiia bacterium]